MSMIDLINSQLALAFNAAGDLVSDATVQKKSSESYNFATQQVGSTQANESVKCVKFKESVEIRDGARRLHCKVLLKADFVLEMNKYSKVVIGADTWDIEGHIAGSLFHVLLKVGRN